MDRVPAGFVVLLVVAAASGCVASIQNSSPTSHDDTGDGQFTAVTVSKAPPNGTIVNYSDERIRANEYLREVVQKAVNESERGVVGVPKNDVSETKEDLRKLPAVTLEESNAAEYDWGHYVRYNQTIVRVQFVVLE